MHNIFTDTSAQAWENYRTFIADNGIKDLAELKIDIKEAADTFSNNDNRNEFNRNLDKSVSDASYRGPQIFEKCRIEGVRVTLNYPNDRPLARKIVDILSYAQRNLRRLVGIPGENLGEIPSIGTSYVNKIKFMNTEELQTWMTNYSDNIDKYFHRNETYVKNYFLAPTEELLPKGKIAQPPQE